MSRNLIAKDLRSPKYRKRVVTSVRHKARGSKAARKEKRAAVMDW